MATVDPSLVTHLPLFAGFAADELGEILREARSERFPRNSAIFEQGEDAHSFFVPLHGHVRASKTTPAGEQVIVLREPHKLFVLAEQAPGESGPPIRP